MKIFVRILTTMLVLLMTAFTVTSRADLVSIVPDNAEQGEALWVSISGSGTHFGQGSSAVTTVWFAMGSSTIYANSVAVGSATALDAHFDISGATPLGWWDVFVQTTGYPVWSLYSGFQITAADIEPIITSVDPDNAYPSQNLWVSITGENTHFSQGSFSTTTVWFTQGSETINAGAVSVYSLSSLNAYFSIPGSASLGFWNVSVAATGFPTVTRVNGFEIQYLCGDVDGNGAVNIADAIGLLGYIFGMGPLPVPEDVADVDCNGRLNMSDVVYIISYIFYGSQPPCAACP